MRRNSNFRRGVLLLITALFWSTGQGQPLVETTTRRTFINDQENVLRNAVTLEPFFERLYRLESGDSGTVNVIHIGDSHIQADFLTEVVRKNLQATFGNAGRGLVVPCRVAGTNEPFNFRTTASGPWDAKRIVHPLKPLPIGIGGITVSTQQDGSSFTVSMKDEGLDYRFDRLTLFLANDPQSYSLLIMDSLSAELIRYTPPAIEAGPPYVNLLLPGRYSHVAIKSFRENDTQSHATLFGLNFENGNRGILYHAIGVNGARYEHYNKATLFAPQTALLKPDVIVISLGTNESVEYPYLKSDFIHQVHSLVGALTANNPATPVILVTPPDAFLRKTKLNPGIEILRRQILEYAVENGIAFWDMHKVVGGTGAASRWKEEGLLRPDGIHFTREGYALQGELLHEAIMKSYGNYVADRHP